jgi:hypothetical protein
MGFLRRVARDCSGFRRGLALADLGQRLFYQAVLSAGSAPFGPSEEAIAQVVALSPNVLPRAGLVGFLYWTSVSFTISSAVPFTPSEPWFLVTRCLIIYYELLTYCYLGVGNGCGMITADKRSHFKIMNIPNKTFLVLMIGAASLAVFRPMASATTMQLTLDYGSRHSGDGGEFNAYSQDFVPATMGYAPETIYNAGHGTGFETFCVETNEYFNPGSTYYYSISQAAINGGVAGGNPDPISKGTAWLYLNFAHHTLAGYDYTTMGQNTSAAQLQATIWWLENETTDPMNQFSMLVTTQFGSAANAMADNNGLYGVEVLNLWGDINHTVLQQDQLVLDVPDGGSTAMLLGLGLLGLFVGRWKLNQRSLARARVGTHLR